MNILQFIHQYYPIEERIKDKLADPYKRIEQMDDLPYDKIGPDEYGNITKLVEVDEVTDIPVIDLISISKEEIDRSDNEALREVWYAYMDQVDITDVNIVEIMECVKLYKNNSERRRAQLDVLSL